VIGDTEKKLNDEQHASLRSDLSRACEDLKTVQDTSNKRVDDMYENWGRFYESQEKRSREFEERFLQKVDELRGGIDRKAELDGVLLSKMRELTGRVEYLARKKEKSDDAQRYLVVYFRDIRDMLKEVDLKKMKTSVQAMHDWKREHIKHHEEKIEPEIKTLVRRGGKIAERILWIAGSAAIGALIMYVVTKLLGG
jgi:hypothetical protein